MRTEAHIIEVDGRLIVRDYPFIQHQSSTIWADFDPVSYKTVEAIDTETQIPFEGRPGWYHDDQKREELIWKRLLTKASWFKVKKKENELQPDLYDKYIGALDHKVNRTLLYPVLNQLFISKSEADEIYRQCCVLFAKDSQGIMFPHPAIKRYCEMASFWDKFGIAAYKSMEEMPHAEFLRMKRISMIESERRSFEVKKAQFAAKNPRA